MFSILNFEIKQKLRNKITLILCLVCVFMLVQIFVTDQKAYNGKIDENIIHYANSEKTMTQQLINQKALVANTENPLSETDAKALELAVLEFENLISQAQLAQTALQEKNWGVYNDSLITQQNSLLATCAELSQLGVEYKDGEPIAISTHGDYWVNFEAWTSNMVTREIMQAYHAQGVPYNYGVEQPTFTNTLFVFLRDYSHIFIPLVIILLAMDVFTRENKDGSFKFTLLSAYPRYKVYFSKITAMLSIAVVFMMAILGIALLLISPIGSIGTWQTPALIHTDTYATTTPLPNNLGYDRSLAIKEQGNDDLAKSFSMYGMTVYSSTDNYNNLPIDDFRYLEQAKAQNVPILPREISEVLNLPYNAQGVNLYHAQLEPSTTGTVMLYTLPLIILTGIFVSSFIGCVSAFSQNKKTVAVLSGGFVLLCVLTTAPTHALTLLQRLNPFLYFHYVPIVTGVGSTTAITGVLVLSLYSLVLIGLGCWRFSNHDIKC